MKDILRQITVILATLITITINILSNALPFNGLNTGQISDRFQVLFVPAGYVFAIWGVVYIGWIAYAIFQALPAQRENPRMRKTGWLVAASGVFNSAWLFLWHYEQFPLTLLAMLGLLAVLIAVYLLLGNGVQDYGSAEKWCAQIPFSVYLGWITVATVANFTSVLDFVQWNRFGLAPEAWMAILLGTVWLLGALISLRRRDIAYNLVLLWALIGIAIKQSAFPGVAAGALVTAGQITATLLYSRVRKS